jgi:hypothetical protein
MIPQVVAGDKDCGIRLPQENTGVEAGRLFFNNSQLDPPIADIIRFSVAGGHRSVFPIADRMKSLGRDAEANEIFADGEGPPFSETSIVFLRPPLVAMARQEEQPVRVFGHPLSRLFQLSSLSARNGRAIEGKIDGLGVKRSIVDIGLRIKVSAAR